MFDRVETTGAEVLDVHACRYLEVGVQSREHGRLHAHGPYMYTMHAHDPNPTGGCLYVKGILFYIHVCRDGHGGDEVRDSGGQEPPKWVVLNPRKA